MLDLPLTEVGAFLAITNMNNATVTELFSLIAEIYGPVWGAGRGGRGVSCVATDIWKVDTAHVDVRAGFTQ